MLASVAYNNGTIWIYPLLGKLLIFLKLNTSLLNFLLTKTNKVCYVYTNVCFCDAVHIELKRRRMFISLYKLRRRKQILLCTIFQEFYDMIHSFSIYWYRWIQSFSLPTRDGQSITLLQKVNNNRSKIYNLCWNLSLRNMILLYLTFFLVDLTCKII